MTSYRSYLSALVGILFLACSVLFVRAQNATLVDVSLAVVPVNPTPKSTVTITAQSFSVDLSQATLTWTYGGKTMASGIGKTAIAVIAPGAGETATVSVSVSGAGFQNVSASVVLNPSSVDMLWEAADAYTPPFYKGKAMLPVGGIFRIVAIPAPGAPRAVTMNWSRNGSALPTASGFNKTSVVLENTIFNPQESIAVTAYGGTFNGNGSLLVSTQTPTVVAYKKTGGFIDYAHGSTQTVTITGLGAVLRFEPYFFSARSGNIFDTTAFKLSVDDQVVVGDPFPNELRISTPESQGTHKMNVDISTTTYSVQHATKSFNLLFQ